MVNFNFIKWLLQVPLFIEQINHGPAEGLRPPYVLLKLLRNRELHLHYQKRLEISSHVKDLFTD